MTGGARVVTFPLVVSHRGKGKLVGRALPRGQEEEEAPKGLGVGDGFALRTKRRVERNINAGGKIRRSRFSRDRHRRDYPIRGSRDERFSRMRPSGAKRIRSRS